jgi:hypothetical protein
MNQEQLIELIYRAIPYSNQIRNIDLSEFEVVRFTWRRTRFRVSTTLHVDEVDSPFLRGSNISLLMRTLLQKEQMTADTNDIAPKSPTVFIKDEATGTQEQTENRSPQSDVGTDGR